MRNRRGLRTLTIRYHVNPKTGEPGRCKAKVSCPYGDINTEHYDSPEEARIVFEKTMDQHKLTSITKLDPKRKLVAQVFEEKISTLKESPQKDFLNLIRNKIYGQTPTELLRWGLNDSRGEFKNLRREDLAEAAEWAIDAFSVGSHKKEFLQKENTFKEILNNSESMNVSNFSVEEKENLAKSIVRTKEELSSIKEKIDNLDEVEKEYKEELLKVEFTKTMSELENGDAVYDGANEFQFFTPDGDAHTVREELSKLDHVYVGRMSIAQGMALKRVQEEAQTLATLINKGEDTIIIPEKGITHEDLDKIYKDNGYDLTTEELEEKKQAVMDERFPPRDGFRLIAAGGENNIYLNENSQMIYKVPHNSSEVLGTRILQENRWGTKDYVGRDRDKSLHVERVLRQGVVLNEDRYARVEGMLNEVKEETGEDVDYIKTYFLHTETENGVRIPIIAQPKLDMEVHRPIIINGMGTKGQKLNATLTKVGFNDLSGDNVYYNTKTDKIILFDCLFIPSYERQSFYDKNKDNPYV